MKPEALELGVSDFVALLNQTLEFAYPNVSITGELANFRVSKNRWVYFDLKDELASVKFFGTVYQLPGPLEDGLLLKVAGQPWLHPLYGFSVNVQSIRPAGEGSIKKAAQLLQAKLSAEGLLDEARKRRLPYPPTRLGLITSKQSAAYADFIKVLNARWRGIDIRLVDVQVQGEAAPGQIVAALEQLNAEAGPPDVIVVIRGGGSAEDLAAFSTEPVARAVAASRVPTLVAIGHETDLSLAELAADRRASTPSNAAELLVPDRHDIQASLKLSQAQLGQAAKHQFDLARGDLKHASQQLDRQVRLLWQDANSGLQAQAKLLEAFNPAAVLRRGYAIVRRDGLSLRDSQRLKPADRVDVQLSRGGFAAVVKAVRHG